MRDAPHPSPHNPRHARRRTSVLAYALAALVVGPHVGYGCLWTIAVVPWLVRDVIYSGSAHGDAALARAEQVLGGGTWRAVATDARAAWTAPDFHGNAQQYLSFTIPLADIPDFEASIRAAWERDPLYRGPDQVREVPYGSDAPAWMAEPLPDGVFYQCGNDTIGISRKTGRILISRIET